VKNRDDARNRQDTDIGSARRLRRFCARPRP